MSGEPEELGYEADAGETRMPAIPPEPFRHLFVDVLADKDATVARVTATISTPDDNPCATMFSATGSSRRDRSDSYDQFTGDTLAIGRALAKLGQKLEKQAQSRINAAVAIREHHEEIAAREKAEAHAAELAQQAFQDAINGVVSQSGSGGAGGSGLRDRRDRVTLEQLRWFALDADTVADGSVAGSSWPGGGSGRTPFPGVPDEITPVAAPSVVFVEIPIPFGRKVRVSKMGEVQVLAEDGSEIRSYYA